MYSTLLSMRHRAARRAMLAFAGTVLIAACDTDEPVAPKPAAVPEAAQSALLPSKTGNIVIKIFDQNQNPWTQPFSGFQITGPTVATWGVDDNQQPDTDPTTGVLLLKSLAPGTYKVCEFGPAIGFGVVGNSCQTTQVFAGATSGLFFVNAPDAYLQWAVRDNAWNPIGGATFTLDSTNVLIGHVGDNVSPDADAAVGIYGLKLPFEAKYKMCLLWLPAGYVLAPNQTGCVEKDVKMGTGWDLGSILLVPIHSAFWNVTDGISLIGPATFKVLSGAISIDVVDNAVNDYNPTLGQVAVKLPAAGNYSVCEMVPPLNHWNAQPSCKRITVSAGVPTNAGTFVNPEKQVYYPGGRTGNE